MSDERVNWKSPVTESDTRFDDSNSDYAVNEKGNFNYHEEKDRETRVAAEEENYYLENFEEISSASSLNKRRKKIQIDRLSELPYSLLIHILSFLYIREAVRTSALSRKWQYLWYDLPKLELCEWSYETDKIRKFVTWVHRALVMRGVTNLEMFSVSFSYKKCFSSDVNIWVEFTFKNKVKEFSFYNISYEVNDLFMLPQPMYSNSSLTCLSLMGCVMAPRRTIDWESLTELHLSYVELRDHVIENILLGCPVLYDLILWKCWGINCLEVNSQSLRELSVEDWRASHDNGSVVEISAPYVHFLTISLDHEGIKLQLTKISPLVLVNFDLNTFGCDCGPVDMMSNIKEIFEDLRHVKKLELGCGCIRALAILALNGWRLPLSARAHLVVNVQTDKHCTSAILDLLESSPNLETLSIDLNNCRYEDCPSCFLDESDSMKSDLNCDLLQLKNVDIKCHIGPDSVGETLLIVAQLLLKRAKVLETMKIKFIEFTVSPSRRASGNTVAQTLLSYPKSSPKAQIIFCE